jgi:hypothetical protein
MGLVHREALTALETVPFAAEREWAVDGVPVLSATVSLPRPALRTNPAARRIDRFYQAQGRAYLRYCERFLFPAAAAEYRQALLTSTPLPQYTAALTYHIACAERGVFSLYIDTQEWLGAQRELHRRGDTWDLAVGYPIPISACFPKRFPVRKTLLTAADDEINRQERAGVSRYHEDWRRALRRHFSRENFYLTPDGLHFFWQMYAIAPAAEGVPDFTLPFCADGCRWPVALDASPKEKTP